MHATKDHRTNRMLEDLLDSETDSTPPLLVRRTSAYRRSARPVPVEYDRLSVPRLRNGRCSGCSGILISPVQVLTAGHCLWSSASPRLSAAAVRHSREARPTGHALRVDTGPALVGASRLCGGVTAVHLGGAPQLGLGPDRPCQAGARHPAFRAINSAER